MKKYRIEIFINGEWKVWNTYDTGCAGLTAEQRAELGMMTARQYGECRLVVLDK